jgi:hypothetical protein
MVTRTVGIVMGASAWIWMLQTLESVGVAGGLAADQAFVQSFDRVLWCAAAVAGLLSAVSYLRWRR